MHCFSFKGGIGTASRAITVTGKSYTVGVLVQCNTGDRKVLRIAGAPVGRAFASSWLPCYDAKQSKPEQTPKCGAGGKALPDRGSIIIVVGTDAPLSPEQLNRVSKRAALGLARLGSYSGTSSGDLIMEIVGFSDHKSTAQVWYRLLNLGFRIPAGAGTDAMANYASLRGPVGMNRVFLETGGDRSPAALKAALKQGRTFASNGPLLGFELDGKRPGDTVTKPTSRTLPYRVAMRSPVAVDHLELVQNGKVLKTFSLTGDRRRLDASGEIPKDVGGWVLLRAWNDEADPEVLDIYPYATTSPIYLAVGGAPPATNDAAYFVT